MQVAITLAVFWTLLIGSEANCPEIPESEDTMMICSNGTIAGSECEVDCSSGLVLLPVSDDPFQAVINCLVNDTWDKDFPYCGELCPPNAKADVVFVIDSSSSMRGVTGRLMRAFLRELISEWRISSENVNVAIVPYNRDVVPNSVLLLNIYPNDKDLLLEAVNVLPANGRGSLTGRALTYVSDFVLTEENGDRPDAPNIVVVMSDGRGQDSVDPPLAALWTRGVTTYAVGFHPRRRRMELLTRQLMKIAQNNPDQMHLAGRRNLGNTDVIMNHMKGVYCLQPAKCNPNFLFNPDNGRMSCSKFNEIGSSCVFTCNQGYSLEGELSSSCVQDRSQAIWTHPPPTCSLDVCTPRRDTLNNGIIFCSDENRVGSICEFACMEPGYVLYPTITTINTCLPSTEWNAPQPCCSRPCPPNAKMDAVFVLDSSSSIGAENWVTMMSFLRNILSSFTVSANGTNFAIFRYNKNVDTKSQILLRDYPNDLEAVLAAFDRIPYDGSGTFTGRAIQHAADNVLTVEAGNRPGFADLVVVVTDGRAADDVLAPSNQLRAMGATILVIGITPPRGSLDREQLLQIAGSESNLFIIEGGFQGLDAAFSIQIADKVCGDPCDR